MRPEIRRGVYSTVGRCKVPDCGVPMLSKFAWNKGVRREGHTYVGGLGMCIKHYDRWTRNGTTDLLPRPTRRAPIRYRAEVLEDYLLIKDDVDSLKAAAARMGMTEEALYRALYRARKDGHTEATHPVSQLMRSSA